jgi:hypothetical protein
VANADKELMLESVTVSEARNLGPLFDRAVHHHSPIRIERWKRDAALLMSEDFLLQLLQQFTFHVNVIPEESGEYTLWIAELDIGAHGDTLATARAALLQAVRAYVRHYFKRWDMYRHLKETQDQLPYVMRLGLARDDQDLGRLLFGSASQRREGDAVGAAF